MKLLVTSDDYGLTYGVTDGIIHAAKNGILTETGLMTNLECSEYAAKRMITECPHILLGEDINIVAGRPVCDPQQIPSMVNQDGTFKTSGQHRQLDKEMPNHIPYEESCIEIESQIQQFIRFVGHKPAYLQGHSYSCENHDRAMRDMAKKFDIPYFMDVAKEHGIRGGGPWNKKPFSLEDQIVAKAEEWVLDGRLQLLQQKIGHIHVHAGFVDADIFEKSTYTIVRANDLACLVSPRVKQWVKDHHIELITIRDVIEQGLYNEINR